MGSGTPPDHPANPRGFPSLSVAGRAASLRLFIPGDPIPKGRPRARVQQGGGKAFAQIYTDPRTREWEDHVEAQVKRQLLILEQIDDGQELVLPWDGRVIASLRFNVPRPASYPKSVTLPLKARGDVDNLAKSVLDAVQNAGVFANDRLVTDLLSFRRYADDQHPVGVEVDLTGTR